MKLHQQVSYGNVEKLRLLLAEYRITVTAAAKALGVSRTGLSLMLNQQAPMRLAYGLALRQLVAETMGRRNL